MDFLINFLGLIASLAVLIWGADKFVDNSSILAKKLGINELTIGLTVVASVSYTHLTLPTKA